KKRRLIADNPAADIKPGDLGTAPPAGRMPALVGLRQAREMLALVEDTPATPQALLAHRFMVVTAMRSNEIRSAQWTQFEGLGGDTPLWRVPKEVMKIKGADRVDHLVPLSRQAVEVITAARSLFGCHRFVFPNASLRNRPISGDALRFLLRRAGYGKK